MSMNKNDQNFLAQKIRTQYIEKGSSTLDELKALDRRVKRPANIFGYLFGITGALVMGSGMSLVMTDIGTTIGVENPMQAGVIIGVAGMLMAIVNYPVYKKILQTRREKYADEIIELSDKILD